MQGLPCRIFVDRYGDDFKHVSSHKFAIEKVALVLYFAGAGQIALARYFKTYLFHTRGGQLWFRFLIAVGEVPRALSVLAPRPARCPCCDAGRGPVGAA